MEGSAITTVFIQPNAGGVERALKVLKRKMHREGTFREMKRLEYYEKPSQVRARLAKASKSRAEKRARKAAAAENGK